MKTINIKKLFQHRVNIRTNEKKLGVDALNENEKAILAYVASRNGTRITDICNEEYFNELSMSTIKRAVLTLQQRNMVKTVVTNDLRERAMVIDLEKEHEQN